MTKLEQLQEEVALLKKQIKDNGGKVKDSKEYKSLFLRMVYERDKERIKAVQANYRSNPEIKEKARQKTAEWFKQNPDYHKERYEETNAKRRERYRNDDDYRENLKERSKMYQREKRSKK